MAKKRGLAANRGLDALLGSIKKEKAITEVALRDDTHVDYNEADAGGNQDIPMNTTPDAQVSETQTTKSVSSAGRISAGTSTSVRKPVRSTQELAHTEDKITQMASKNKQPLNNVNNSTNVNTTDEEMTLVQMDVDCLQAGKYQPRRDMSETALGELAASIRQHGVMQPIVIRPLLDSEIRTVDKVTHEIIAGERRWRAAKMAGQSTIPAIERALSDELAIALALIENIQREDLSVIEQAEALQRFHTEFNMSHAMIAEVVGKARTTVSNLLRLNHLHETVKNYLSDGSIDMGHARALLSLSAEQQPVIADKIIAASMTVREAEKLVKSILNPEDKSKKDNNQSVEHIEKLSQKLSDKIGATVKLKQKKGGKGSMEIFFHSPEELQDLLKHFE